MSKLYEKVKQFVFESFGEDEIQRKHFLQTVYWVKKLKPNADEAFEIAAISHDIERTFRNKESAQAKRAKRFGFRDPKFLKFHQEEGARIMGEFLKKNKAPQNLIEKVQQLISKHEVGGDDGQNILKDADSISFFETSVYYFLSLKDSDPFKIREKIDWMFNRITSTVAKQFAKRWYDESIKKLS